VGELRTLARGGV
jgi:hypothetical protein